MNTIQPMGEYWGHSLPCSSPNKFNEKIFWRERVVDRAWFKLLFKIIFTSLINMCVNKFKTSTIKTKCRIRYLKNNWCIKQMFQWSNRVNSEQTVIIMKFLFWKLFVVNKQHIGFEARQLYACIRFLFVLACVLTIVPDQNSSHISRKYIWYKQRFLTSILHTHMH